MKGKMGKRKEELHAYMFGLLASPSYPAPVKSSREGGGAREIAWTSQYQVSPILVEATDSTLLDRMT